MDSDGDGVPNSTDCAPQDNYFSQTHLNLHSFAAVKAAIFAPVEALSDWKITDEIYRQLNPDGLRRSTVTATSVIPSFLATVTFRFSEAGNAGLKSPSENISFAGVIVRMVHVTNSKDDGYYCGVDLANHRLLVAKSSGTNLANKTLVLFSESHADKPGKTIIQGVQRQAPYRITFRVVQSQLKCQALLPDGRQVEVSYQDTALKTGGFSLFTLGAAANFETVKLCTSQ
jgi:hypothetical protein